MFNHIDFECADITNDIEWFKENYPKYKAQILIHKRCTIYDYPNFDKWLISIGEVLTGLGSSTLKAPYILGPPNTPRENISNNCSSTEPLSTPSPCM